MAPPVLTGEDDAAGYLGVEHLAQAEHLSGHLQVSRAAGQGYGRIRLGCIAENRESFPFWSAMGFREVSRTVTRAEGRRDWNIIVMERPLP